MKKKKNRILLGVLLFAVCLGGCNLGGRKVIFTNGLGSQDVFRIGDASCTLAEARVYLANYQNIYGKSYGIDLWKQKFQQDKLKQYIKEIALSEMSKIVCMDLLAEEQNIVLDEEEEERIKQAAAEYYQSLTKEEQDFMGVSEAEIVSMYEDYVLANKVYQSLTMGIDAEVSDDEARIMEAMQIFVKDKNSAKEVKQRLKSGEDFAAVASNYNKKPVIEITFGRGDLPEEVEKAAFELDNGDVSSRIAADDGFYFIKCVNKFNEELTDANKSNIVEEREKAAFDDVYEEFVSGLSSKINEKVWDDITLVTDGSITTNRFFEIIEGAMN